MVLDLGVQKRPVDVSFKKVMRQLLTNKFAGGDPHTFLKSAHALFEHPKSFTLSLPSSTPCFHRHLKQIAAPAGTCYLRKHSASPEPAGKALNVGYRKEKKMLRCRGGSVRKLTYRGGNCELQNIF